jgi:SAM-dependent methyltransferase
MSFASYVAQSLSKMVAEPKKIGRLLDPRAWRHAYWVARFGTPSDLHESRWSFEGDVGRRRYKNYDEYVAHQASKVDDASFRKKLEAQEEEQYLGFRRRFELAPEIVGKKTVLCLGARLGTEVRAFKDMGYFAVGVDLNPGGANRHVVLGDFHALTFADGSVDVVYTNVLDHAFDLTRVMGEVRRILAPNGVALLEVIRGVDEGYLPQEYESVSWKTARSFADRLAETSAMPLMAFRSNAEVNDPYWNQVVLAKS